jgi:hypothetical protein
LGDERVDVVGQLLARSNTPLPREPSEVHERRHAIAYQMLAEAPLLKPYEVLLDVAGEPATSDAADFSGEEQLLQHEDLLGRRKRRPGILKGLPLCGYPRRLAPPGMLLGCDPGT